jgi:HEAT repeat protein
MFERFKAGRKARRAARSGDAATLVTLLASPDPKVRASTANECMLFRPRPAPASLTGALLRAAADAESEVRGMATLALGELRAEEGPDVFLRGLSDPDWGVRMFAATAIGWMPDPRATRLLQGLLEDEQPFVRQFAVFALGEIGDPVAIPAIERLLETERDREVKKWAKEAAKKLRRR